MRSYQFEIESPYTEEPVKAVVELDNNLAVMIKADGMVVGLKEYQAIGKKLFEGLFDRDVADSFNAGRQTVKNNLMRSRRRNSCKSTPHLTFKLERLGLLDYETYCGINLMGESLKREYQF